MDGMNLPWPHFPRSWYNSRWCWARAAISFPASFELLPQTAYGHSNMTRPLAAGGFFVALVPEEPFLGKYNFYGTRLTWENSVFRF